jgi:anti-anti-sigma factor
LIFDWRASDVFKRISGVREGSAGAISSGFERERYSADSSCSKVSGDGELLVVRSREQRVSFFYISDDSDNGDQTYGADVAVLVVSGELDYSASPQLKQQILDRVKAGKRRLVIDLSAVTFIDSMAIGVLVGSATRLREMGGSLLAVCAEENERVLRIFDIAGVASSIALHRSLEEARSGLLAAPPAEGRAWVAQATVVASTAPPLSAHPAGLAAARKYDRAHSGHEVDRLA